MADVKIANGSGSLSLEPQRLQLLSITAVYSINNLVLLLANTTDTEY